MYEFRDTIDHSDLTVKLPSEAMNFGGVFLENEVEGYKTLTVTGREPLIRNVQSVKIGRSDGETFKSSSLGSREIKIKFAIFTATPEAYQLKLTELKSLIYVGETEIWFNDDKTRGINGIVSEVNVTSESGVIVRGEIIIYCPNPNWHTLIETKITATNGVATISYPNSYMSKPRISATMQGDNGFVGVIDNAGNVLQFGTPEEVDGVVVNKSVTRVSDIVANDFNTSNITQRGWTFNNAPALLQVNGTSPVQSADMIFGEYSIFYDKWKGQKIKYLSPAEGEFGPTVPFWHGPAMTQKFKPLTNLNNSDSAKDFTFMWEMNFIIGSTLQTGCHQWVLSTKDNKILAGVVIYKNTSGSNATVMQYWINGVIGHTENLDPTTRNPFVGWDGGNFSIEKFGNKITFSNHVNKKEFTVNSTVAAMEASQISVHIGAWDTVPLSGKGSPIMHNHIRSIRFTQHRVPFWNDIPNRFSRGDVLVIDTNTGNVLLNGIPNASLGALGNDWEKFGIVTGENKITFVNSDFATPTPIYDIYYKGVDV